MNTPQNIKGIVIGAVGLAIQVGSVMSGGLPGKDTEMDGEAAMGILLVMLGVMLGTALLILGLSLYARARGRSGWWGLFGLLGFVGVVVVGKVKERDTAKPKKPPAEATHTVLHQRNQP